MQIILGYTCEQWDDIYRLSVHDGRTCKDMFEFLSYWRSKPKDTPDDCIAIAAGLSQAMHKDASPMRELLKNFLTGVHDE